MNCHSFNNVLDLYREGRLSPRRAKAAARHLESCAGCRALAVTESASAPPRRAPQALKDKLRAAAKAGPAEAPAAAVARAATDLPLWPREARGVALAAVALLVVGLLIAAAGAPSQSASGGAVAAAEEP